MARYSLHPYPSPKKIRTDSSCPDRKSLDMKKRSHRPEDILTEVKNFTSQPDYHQNNYKSQFVRLFKCWAGMKTPSNVRKLREDLAYAMASLDAFFFAGSLTLFGYRERGRKEVELKFEANIFAQGHCGYKARLRIPEVPILWGLVVPHDGEPTIYIDALNNGAPRTVKSIFETLVHEMVHAIYCLYECKLDHGFDHACDVWAPDVLGYSNMRGHGRLWVEMMELMMTEIQSWDESLSEFLSIEEIMRHHRVWP